MALDNIPTDRHWYMQYFTHRGYRVQVLPNGREWCHDENEIEFDTIGRSGFHATLPEAYQAALQDALTRAAAPKLARKVRTHADTHA